jgi:hypothetical protein
VAQANYKVTITDHDYHYTTYIAWVQATSKNQAIAKAAALAGGEKTRREWQRMGREPMPEGLLEPDVKLEPVGLDEYWDHQEQVVVQE